jgi:DNA recombination protein Rad52
MTLTPEQIAALKEPLDTKRITNRKDKPFDYLEGYDCIDKANEIFGFDGWSYDVAGIEQIGEFGGRVMIEARVQAYVGGIYREDIGHGISSNATPEAIETARKGAVTDALKRALRSFGNQFGNSLYDKDHDRGGSTPAATPSARTAQGSARPLPPSEKQIETISSLLHQLDDLDQLETASVCERFKIDMEPKTDGLHFGKGIANAIANGTLTKTAASTLIDELMTLTKKPVTQVSSTAGVGGESSRETSSGPKPSLPSPEDIHTAGDLFTASRDHFKLQRAEVFDLLGVEKAEQIRDFGAAWKMVVATKRAQAALGGTE